MDRLAELERDVGKLFKLAEDGFEISVKKAVDAYLPLTRQAYDILYQRAKELSEGEGEKRETIDLWMKHIHFIGKYIHTVGASLGSGNIPRPGPDVGAAFSFFDQRRTTVRPFTTGQWVNMREWFNVGGYIDRFMSK